MKNRKHRIESFSFFDHTGIEKHLEEMAKKGWLLAGINSFTWVYRRIEPKKVHFAVTYYPKVSEFDPEPQEGQIIYREYSEHSGWKFVCSSAQMQIFYNEEENPVPMETDPVVEVEVIHQAAQRGYLPSYILLLTIYVLNVQQFFSRLLRDPIEFLSDASRLAIGICWPVLIVYHAVELFTYYHWRHRAIKAAENGAFLETPNHSLFKRVNLTAAIAFLLYIVINQASAGNRIIVIEYMLAIVCLIVLIIILDVTKHVMKRMGASRSVNFTITMIITFYVYFALMSGVTSATLNAAHAGQFHSNASSHTQDGNEQLLYQDEIPLSVEDLLDVDRDDYILENSKSESILLGSLVVHHWPKLDSSPSANVPELNYNIAIIKMPTLYDFCKERLLSKKKDSAMEDGTVLVNHYEKIDPAPWLAEEAYQLHWSKRILDKYLLCYEDRIIEIDFDWTPTEEQMRIVAEKLAPMR